MKTKRTLTAAALATILAGNAQAATNPESMEVLRAIMSLDIPNTYWVNENDWAGVEAYARTQTNLTGNRNSFRGSSWVIGGESAACDSWAGVLCVDGNITYLEIPFAEMNNDLSAFMAALEPVAGSLKSLNLVGNTNLHGSAEGLQQLTQLQGLYLDNIGMTGDLPDLGGMADLRFAGLNDNPGLTGLAGGVGGEALEVLNLNNTPNFSADVTAALAPSRDSLERLNLSHSGATGQIPDYGQNTALNYFKVGGSGVGGALNLAQAGQIEHGNFDATGTGVSPGTGTDGLSIAPSVAAAGSVGAVANGANAMRVSWLAAAGAEGYLVAYSSDGGENWSADEFAGGTLQSAEISSLAAGDYVVSVTAYGANPTTGVRVQGTTTMGTGSVTVTDQAPGDDGGSGSGGVGRAGGGGAALWLGLLPLAALLRRRR